jgi:hypothetical protein
MSFDGGDFTSPTGIQWQGHTGVVQYGNDNLVVMFYNKPTHNPGKSVEAGRPIHEDKLYVRYHAPMERLNINDRPAHDGDKRRWPIQWQQFSKQLEQRPEGTPVEMLYPGKPAIARTLNGGGVFTIEQLASLSEHAIDQVGMGGRSWVNDAVRYIEAANKGVKASQLKHELDERDSRIRTLELKLEQALAEIERQRAGNGVDAGQMGNIQQMIANAVAAQMGQRPAMPHNPGPAFDAQTSQINNTSERVLPPRGPGRPRKVTT